MFDVVLAPFHMLHNSFLESRADEGDWKLTCVMVSVTMLLAPVARMGASLLRSSPVKQRGAE